MTDPLRIGSYGPEVGAVHQALLEAGYTVAADELAAGRFGSSTHDAVRAFQASHLGPDRHPLAEDAVVGPATVWALQHPGIPGESYTVRDWRYDLNLVRSQVRRVVEVAVGELGVHENPDGSNRGARVDVYTQPNLGVPWCAAFVSWCFTQGLDDGSPFGRILSTWGLYNWANSRGAVLGAAACPQPGDVFVILRDQAHGHTGLIVSVLDDGRLATAEGNASNAVRGVLRARSAVSAVLRPVPLV